MAGTKIQRWRVPLGFLSAAIFLVFAQPVWWSLCAGGAIAVLGLLVRAWSAGHIRKNAALAVSGPYAHTRNPLYFGSFLLGLGFTIAAGNWWLVALFAAIFLVIYLPVMRLEAEDLRGLFGADFENYARTVPLFVPRVFPAKIQNSSDAKFDFDLYLRHREYQAALGLIAVWSLLALKARFF